MYKKYKSTEVDKEQEKEKSIKQIETISKKEIKKERLCNNCRSILPDVLDRGICPKCGVKN